MPYTAPTSAQVAALLRTRTKSAAGQYADDFSATSTPTQAQVEALIEVAGGLILPGLGSLADADLTDGCRAGVWSGASSLVALGAAMLVEQGYWPEQIGQGDQTAARLIYDLLTGDIYDRIARAAAACRGETGGGDEDVGGSGYGSPAYAFPEDRGGLVGWGSRWLRPPRRVHYGAYRRHQFDTDCWETP